MSKHVAVRLMVAISVLSSTLIAFQNCSQKLSVQDVASTTTDGLSSDLNQKFDRPEIKIISVQSAYAQRNFEIPFSIKIDPRLEVQSVECIVQGHSAVECHPDRISIRNIQDGPHILRLKVKDSRNQISDEVSFNFLVDATAPRISILSQPMGVKKERSAEFSFQVADDISQISKVECSFNNSVFSNCSSFSSHSLIQLSDGSYALTIRATDVLGNQSIATSQSWQVDTAAPVLTISKRPNSQTNVTQQLIEFSTVDAGGGSLQLSCKLNSSPTSSCTSPTTFNVNASVDGLQTALITATDQAGNSVSQTIQWTLDRVQPNLIFSATPGTRSALQTFRFEFNATDLATGVTSVKCSLNGAAFVNCNSNTHHVVTLTDQGPMSFAVRAFDGAGNVSFDLTHNWIVDLSAPTIAVISRPQAMTRTIVANFQISITDNGNTNLTNSCQHNSNNAFACTNSFTINSVEGDNRLKITSVDDQNNRSELTLSWTLDTMAPVMSYLRSLSPTILNANQLSIEFAATDAHALTYECVVNNAGLPINTISNCSSGIVISNLVTGSFNVRVTAKDTAGNVSNNSELNRVIDLVGPTVSGLAFSDTSPTNKNSLSATFSVSDVGSGVDQIKCKISHASQSPTETTCASPLNLTNYPDGELKVEVWSIDKAGNPSNTQVKSIMIDRVLPTRPNLILTGSFLRSTRTLSYTFSSTDSSGAPTYLCQVAGHDASEQPCTSPQSVTLSADGNFEIRVRARDFAGNFSELATTSVTIDTSPPIVPSLSTTSLNPTTSSEATFSFSSSDSGSGISHFVCEFNGSVTSPCVSPRSVVLFEGLNRFRVKAVNLVGLETAFKDIELTYVKPCVEGYKPVTLRVYEGVPVDFKIPTQCLNASVGTTGVVINQISNFNSTTYPGLSLNSTTGSIVGTPLKATDNLEIFNRLFMSSKRTHQVQFTATGLSNQLLNISIRILPAHCSTLSGEGTETNPFLIKNTQDFFCMNSFYREQIYWSLENSIAIKVEDRPSRFFDVNYGASTPFEMNRLHLISSFTGVFNGNGNQISYLVDCNISDCQQYDWSTGNVAIFGGIRDATIQNLKSKLEFRQKANTSQVNTQYISGLISGGSGQNKIHRVRTTVEVRDSMNVGEIAGVSGALGWSSTDQSQLSEIYTTIRVINSQPSFVSGLVPVGGWTIIQNSFSDVFLDLIATPNSRPAYLSLTSLKQVDSSSSGYKLSVESSYMKTTVVSNSLACLFTPIGLLTSGPPSYTANSNTTITNTFWAGDVRFSSACSSTQFIGPAKVLPTEYGGTISRFNFNTSIWRTGADGLPVLRWLDQ